MEIQYRTIRSSRRTTSIEIKDGIVLVRCPNHMGDEDVRRVLREHGNWIRTQLEQYAARPQFPPLTMEQVRDLADRAVKVIPERVAYFAPKVGVTYGRITIRNQRSLWGSCSGKGNLNFNCLLMLVPPEVLDYVVVHELCHRKEMNHSSKFWAQVERVLPDYRQRLQWLKDNGSALIARLP